MHLKSGLIRGLAFIKGNLVVQNVFYFRKSGLISGVTFGRSDLIRGDTVLSHITSVILLFFYMFNNLRWEVIGRLQNKPWHFSDSYTLLYNTVKPVLSLRVTSMWPSYAFGIDRCTVYSIKCPKISNIGSELGFLFIQCSVSTGFTVDAYRMSIF